MTRAEFCRIVPAAGMVYALFLAMTVEAQTTASRPLPDGVGAAARAGLQRFLTQLPRADLSGLGIPALVPADRITLGTPFPLDQILPASLDAYTNGTPASALFSPTTQYLCLVLTDEVVCALLIVDRMNAEWRAVSIGHPELAAEFGRVLADWPESRGSHVRFAVSPQARQHVFTVAEKGAANLTLLRRPGTGLQAIATGASIQAAAPQALSYQTLAVTSNVVAGLKAAADQNRSGPRPEKDGQP